MGANDKRANDKLRDIKVTKEIKEAGEFLRIKLLDQDDLVIIFGPYFYLLEAWVFY